MGGGRLIQWNYNRKETTFRTDLFKVYLQDFIEGKNSFLSNNPTEAVYGWKVYNNYQEKFHIDHEIKNDVRFMHIIWEHKKVMLARIEYMMHNNLMRFDNTLLEEYKTIVRNILIIKNLHLKYKISQKESLIPTFFGKLNAMVQKELEYYNRIFEMIVE